MSTNDQRGSDPLKQRIKYLAEQIGLRRQKDRLDCYISDLEALCMGQVHQELTSQLIDMGVEPKTGMEIPPEDILKRYKSIPLHTIFLYTSEDQDVVSYIIKHWGALHTLSGDFCDIYPSINQFKNAEDAYDFIEKLDVVQQSNFRAYSQLPGLFFWDNGGATEYISFGPDASSTSIRRVLRTVFEEIRLLPSIASITYARKVLDKQFRIIPGSKSEQQERRDSMSYADLNALLMGLDNLDCLIATHKYMKQVQRALKFASNLFHKCDKIWQAECIRAKTYLRKTEKPVLPGDPLAHSMSEIFLGDVLHGIHQKVNQLIRLVDDFCLDCETQSAQTDIKLERILAALDHDLPEAINLTALLSGRLQQLQPVSINKQAMDAKSVNNNLNRVSKAGRRDSTQKSERTSPHRRKKTITRIEDEMQHDSIEEKKQNIRNEINHQEDLLKKHTNTRRMLESKLARIGNSDIPIELQLNEARETEEDTKKLLNELRQQLSTLE